MSVSKPQKLIVLMVFDCDEGKRLLATMLAIRDTQARGEVLD